jgi:hypothetical protein
MLLWSRRDQPSGYTSTSSRWSEEVAIPNLRTPAEKDFDPSNTGMPTPEPSTHVDESLPIPVVQNRNAPSSIRRKRRSARFGGLALHWARLKKRVIGTAPSSSSIVGDSAAECSYTLRMEAYLESEEVNEVVVDRVWSEDVKTSLTQSELGPSPERTGSYPIGPSASDNESVHYRSFWTLCSYLAVLRWRLWPVIVHFFSSRFADEKSEQHYAQVRLTPSNLTRY